MKPLSVNQLTTMRWSLEETLSNYPAAGIQALGLWRNTLADYSEDQAVTLLADSGMKVSNLFWIGDFFGNHHLTYRDALEDALQSVQLGARLQCNTLVIYCGGRATFTLRQARKVLADAINELLPVARARNLELALELIHPVYAKQLTILPTIRELLDFIHELKHSGLRIALDAYHWGLQSQALELLPELLPHIGLVTLSDGRETPPLEEARCRLGDGKVPLVELFAALRAYGYDGYYDLKLTSLTGSREHPLELIQHARAVYERLLQPDAVY